MKGGDLVRWNPDPRIGIIVDFETVYDKYGDPVDRLAIVSWQGDSGLDSEYPDMLEVISECKGRR